MCSAKRLSEKERKTEIMNSAMEVISKKGLSNTTMEDIIAGTILLKGGVYHYYGNVIEIFKDIMVLGIEYRIEIIKEHLDDCKKAGSIHLFFIFYRKREKIDSLSGLLRSSCSRKHGGISVMHKSSTICLCCNSAYIDCKCSSCKLHTEAFIIFAH